MEAPPEVAIFRVGDVLVDTFEIRSIIGQGSMGQVFDAHDRALGRRVAIKANWPDVPQSVRTEARALAAVRHPCVVAVHALLKYGGVDFMVMEHVSGVSLAHQIEHLDHGGLPLVERLDVLIAMADGLAAIHRAGISHGDMKPDNVLLAANGRVVLTDLGLVRAAYEPDEGLVAGTPAFMAPEIVSSQFANAGWHLVDVYAFGVIAYLVLSGRLPFASESELDVVLMHAESPIPLLSEGLGIPKRLVELVAQLMAKEPTDRPATMDAAVWQLRAARTELARVAATVAPPSSARDMLRNKRPPPSNRS